MRYLYSLYALLVFLVFFLLLLPFIYLFGFLGERGQKGIWYLLKGWSYVWFFLLGMRIRRRFEETPNPKNTYIVIANHSSYLDSPFIFRSFPFPVLPLATEGFSRIPVFGFLYRKMTVLVNRKSAESRQQSARRLYQTLSRKKSILIFPEGGIPETEDGGLGTFYNGAFRLALETGIPILPVIFPDTRKRWRPGSFWNWQPGLCRALFLKEIDVNGHSLSSLKERTHAQMQAALEKLS